MSERCPDCGYFKQEYNADPEFDCVNTGDINCESRALKLLRAKLTKLEAVVEAQRLALVVANQVQRAGDKVTSDSCDTYWDASEAFDAAKAELEKVR
jgi:hypothetical protein